MSLNDYIERIVSLANIEESTLVLTLIYADRICEKNRIQLNYLTVFKYNNINKDSYFLHLLFQ